MKIKLGIYSGLFLSLGLTTTNTTFAAGDLSLVDTATQQNFYQWPVNYTDQPTSPSSTNIPAPTVAMPAPSTSKTGTYRVQAGETLFGVMRKTGSHVQELIKLNGLSPPYAIKAGQTLRVSSNTGTANTTSKTSSSSSMYDYQYKSASSSGSYTVAHGETLYAVARATNVSVKQLIQLNGLTAPYHVRAGQVLKISAN